MSTRNTTRPITSPDDDAALGWEAWVVAATIFVVLTFLYLEKGSPEQIMLGGMLFVWTAGIINTKEALSGFANEAVITVGALFVMVKAVERSKAVDRAAYVVMGAKTSPNMARWRLCLASFFLSAVTNNTPYVAIMIPIIRDWARGRGLAPSKFLMPMNFATILGGLLTTIGTSTNLLVNGLMLRSKLEPFSFFEPGILGLPVGMVGMAYLCVLGHRCLAEKGGLFREVREHGEELVAALEVLPDAKAVGRKVFKILEACKVPRHALLQVQRCGARKVEPAGPDGAEGAAGRKAGPARAADTEFLGLLGRQPQEGRLGGGLFTPAPGKVGGQKPGDLEAQQEAEEAGAALAGSKSGDGGGKEGGAAATWDATDVCPVPEQEVAQAGDVLVLSMAKADLIDLASQRNLLEKNGLQVCSTPVLEVVGPKSEFVELVLGFESPLTGQRIDQGTRICESTYHAGLVAVRRRCGGGSIRPPPDDQSPQPAAPTFVAGDTVLVLAPVGTDFSRTDFLVVTRVAELPPPAKLYDYVPLLLFTVAMVLGAVEVLPMVQVALILASLCVLGGWVKAREMRNVVDWQLLILLGASLGLSGSMDKSHLSRAIAGLVVGAGLPKYAAAGLLFLVVMALTELASNGAAAALSLPLAIDLSRALKLPSPRPLALIVMIAASTGYASPIGYQTNLMILGPGGYTFCDFARVGIPLDLIVWVGTIALMPLLWPID